jgi:hypothetical protein
MPVMTIEYPTAFQMDKRETLPIAFDMSHWLGQGDTVTFDDKLPVELRRVSDGNNYAEGLQGSVGTAGQLVIQSVGNLEPGERYYLIVPFVSRGATFAPRLQITCAKL